MSIKKKAMVLVAHADDETLGAGGLIIKLLRAQWDVSVVIMANGIVTARQQTDDNRAHVDQACKVLGAKEPIFLEFPDQRLDTIAIADLANAVGKLDIQPDLIITHVDTDLNADHRIVLDVAKIIGRPKSKPVAIIGIEIPGTSDWNCNQFPANYFIDITGEIDRKVEAFLKYENEVQPYPHPWSDEGLRLLARRHGMTCGYEYAEAFKIYRAHEGLIL
jgi:LmbE family N-acetylglucosaminyl deacetylase